MIQVRWVVASLLLVSFSIQQPLSNSGNGREASIVPSRAVITNSPDSIIEKRSSPERERNLSATPAVRPIAKILEEWDDLEDPRHERRAAGKARKLLVKEVIGMVPYNSLDKRGYVTAIYDLLQPRVNSYKNLINRNITKSAPDPDKKDFPDIYLDMRKHQYRQESGRGRIARRQSSAQEGSSSQQREYNSPKPQYYQYEIPQGYDGEQQWNAHPFSHDGGNSMLQPPMTWPHDYSTETSTGHQEDYTSLSNVEDVASMFPDNPESQDVTYRHRQ